MTLDDLASQFFLSKPYISKFIREKSGLTFGDHVRIIRMRKAEVILKNEMVSVETVAEAVGYQNVEHFIRLFKKQYGMTPVQFRNMKN